MLARLFKDHPASVDETYMQHMGRAFGFGGRMICAGLACMLHALLPFLFVTTGSDAMAKLHEEMSARRAKALAGVRARREVRPQPVMRRT
ncbi:MAG: DUF6356 family protein [Parvularculaceae bacterium]